MKFDRTGFINYSIYRVEKNILLPEGNCCTLRKKPGKRGKEVKEIHISVQDRVAYQSDKTVYLCGDGDFAAVFDFDAEWAQLPVRTARFQTENGYTDVVFRGNRCPVPVLNYARKLEIGVYAGNVHTTTPARISLREGIRAAWGTPEDPAPSIYDQLMEQLMDSYLDLETTEDGVRLTVHYRGGESTGFLRHSEIYVGSGQMPEGYRIQLDPSVQPPILRVKDLEGNYIPLPAIRGEKGDKGDRGEPGPQGPRGDIGVNVVRKINGIEPGEAGALTLTAAQVGALPVSGGEMTGALSMGGGKITRLASPGAASDAANKAYVDEKRKTYAVDLDTQWTGSGPYSQKIAVAGIQESDMPHIGPVYDENMETAAAQKEAWECVNAGKTEDGAIVFICLEEKPTVAIPLQIEVMR